MARRGRKAVHQSDAERKAAAAEACRRYRARQRAVKAARQGAARNAAAFDALQATTVIDLSPLRYSHRVDKGIS